MKNIFYILSILIFSLSCQKEAEIFNIDISAEKLNLRFEPISGGAVMRYDLPNNNEIFSINIRYEDVLGKQATRTASYNSDSLIIIGFNEAVKSVKGEVVLLDREKKQSEVINVTFDTKTNDLISVIDESKVAQHWGGFSVEYDAPWGVNGFMHVLYAGTNPLTNEPDTLLVESFAMRPEDDIRKYPLEKGGQTNTIILRVEQEGYIVKERIVKDVPSLESEKLDGKSITFHDPLNLVIDMPKAHIGVKYLFDGELTGAIRNKFEYPDWNNNEMFTFVAGPFANESHYILEFAEPKELASIRIYGMLNLRYFPNSHSEPVTGHIWQGNYAVWLPCGMKIFVSNDINAADDKWEEVASFSESRTEPIENRWCYRSYNGWGSKHELESLAEVKAAEPQSKSLEFLADGRTWKYLKFQVTLPDGTKQWATSEYFTLHELEVYVKK